MADVKASPFKKTLRGWLIAALICSVALPPGVFLIVFGAVEGIWAVMIVGILLTVAGFYGTPFLWLRYSALIGYKGVYCLIAEDGVTSVDKIASTLGKRRNKVVSQINYLLARRYLVGYVYDGADTVAPVVCKEKPAFYAHGKCPNCGAVLTADEGRVRCPYCGTDFGKYDRT